jgi:hypothetical protein
VLSEYRKKSGEEWGNGTACLVFLMFWYIKWGKLVSDFSTFKMALWFLKDYLFLNSTVVYSKNLICLKLKL